jgi:hypothetical protein
MATEAEKGIVSRRANHRCEYCRAPENVTGYAFHIEHVRSRAQGGEDNIDNYALSCMPCNRAKWHHLTGEDLQTGKQELLFDPRKHQWDEHFRVEKRIYVRGKTAIGRATENRLQMNQPRQLEARRLWLELDVYP